MHACKRLRLTADTHAYIEQHAQTAEPDATPDYAAELQALPAGDAESELSDFESDESTEPSDSDRDLPVPELLDVAALWAYHFDYHALGN